MRAGRGHERVEQVVYAARACACLSSNYCRARALQYDAHTCECCPALYVR